VTVSKGDYIELPVGRRIATNIKDKPRLFVPLKGWALKSSRSPPLSCKEPAKSDCVAIKEGVCCRRCRSHGVGGCWAQRGQQRPPDRQKLFLAIISGSAQQSLRQH
jgi:hypothetical protein